MFQSFAFLQTVGLALGGTILWDGRFNGMSSSAEIADWSWSSQVGPYQYYIHGSEAISSYVNLDSTFKNPADTASTQGVKITLDSTSYWNGQTMRRTELIPQTSAAINAGKVYYHFSIQRTAVNPPSEFREHQIAFFESHFTELKSGWQSGAIGTSDPLLRWDVSSVTMWNTTWEAGVWHNVAYGIDFGAGSVEFYHSTGADDLVLTHEAVNVAASSNGEDWHLGVLELPRDGYADGTEDIYFSGVYVESGDVTLSVSGPGGASSSSLPASSIMASATPAPPLSVVSTEQISSISNSIFAPTSTTVVGGTSLPTTFSTVVSSSASPISTDTSSNDDDNDCA